MSRSADIALTAAAPVAWGTTYVVTTQLLPPDRPLLAATLRALPIGVVIVSVYRRLPPTGMRLKVATLSLFNIGLFFALLFVAAFQLPGGVAATVIALTPVLVVFVAWPLLGIAPAIVPVFTALLGTAGVGLVALQGSGTYHTIGLIAGLGAAFSVAVGVVLQRRWALSAPAALMAGWQLALSGLVLLLVTLVAEGIPSHLTEGNVVGVAYLTSVGTGLTYVLWFRGIRLLGPHLVTLLSLISPVVALFAGFLLLNQALTLRQAFGVGLVLIAIISASLWSRPSQP